MPFASMMDRVLNYGKDDKYIEEIQNILSQPPFTRVRNGPTMLFDDFIYIGGYSDANNADNLKRLGITHVVNCAEFRLKPCNPYSPDTGVTAYISFDAEDHEDYDMMQHFDDAYKFISSAKEIGGKVLVHCAMGINRSAAICAAYIMVSQSMDILTTVQQIKSKKGMVLCNRGFQKGLVKLAREKKLLPDLPVKPP